MTLILDAPQYGGEIQIHSDRDRFEAACAAGAVAFSPLEVLVLLNDPDADIESIVAVKRVFGSDSRVQRNSDADDAVGAPAAPGRAARRPARVVRRPAPEPVQAPEEPTAEKKQQKREQQGVLPL